MPVVETADGGGGGEGREGERGREGGRRCKIRTQSPREAMCTHTPVGTRASMLSMRARISALHESGRSLLVPAGKDAKHVLRPAPAVSLDDDVYRR